MCPKYKFFDMQDLHSMQFALLPPEAKFIFKFFSDFKLSVQFILGKINETVYILLYIQKIKTN